MSIKNLLLLVLIICSANLSLRAQNIIELLDSEEYLDNLNAVKLIELKNETEYIPELLSRMDKKDLAIQALFLTSLGYFNYENLNEEIYAFLSRLDNASDLGFYPYDYYKAKVIYILVKHNDYSFKEYLYEHLYESNPRISNYIIFSIITLFKDYPELREEALNKLLLRLENDQSLVDPLSFVILNMLREDYEDYETILKPVYINAFYTSEDNAIIFTVFKTLYSYYDGDLHELIKNNLQDDKHFYFCTDLIDTLLTKYGTPNDLKIAKDHLINETLIDIKELMGLIINNFKVPEFPESDTPLEMLIKIEAYIIELMELNWVNSNFYLNEIITIRQESFEGPGLYVDPIPRIENILRQLDIDSGTVITREGHMFIDQYMHYLLDKIRTKE